ncbi:hypothetical protein HMPREF1572_01092 [Gardnerella vaginalis JCP7275]|nr:hypothetical protein HMPREF1572_01092 [Gardnerella vaginalis JCP7275]
MKSIAISKIFKYSANNFAKTIRALLCRFKRFDYKIKPFLHNFCYSKGHASHI